MNSQSMLQHDKKNQLPRSTNSRLVLSQAVVFFLLTRTVTLVSIRLVVIIKLHVAAFTQPVRVSVNQLMGVHLFQAVPQETTLIAAQQTRTHTHRTWDKRT